MDWITTALGWFGGIGCLGAAFLFRRNLRASIALCALTSVFGILTLYLLIT